MENIQTLGGNAILEVPKDSLIFKAYNCLIRNYDEIDPLLGHLRDADRQHGYRVVDS